MSEQCAGPYGWFCEVRIIKTGKVWTYWVNGPHMTREDLAAHILKFYPKVAFLSCQPAITPPDGNRLQPVPGEHFQHGIMKQVEEELSGGAVPARQPLQRLQRRRLL